jgi:hypothetical protein
VTHESDTSMLLSKQVTRTTTTTCSRSLGAEICLLEIIYSRRMSTVAARQALNAPLMNAASSWPRLRKSGPLNVHSAFNKIKVAAPQSQQFSPAQLTPARESNYKSQTLRHCIGEPPDFRRRCNGALRGMLNTCSANSAR